MRLKKLGTMHMITVEQKKATFVLFGYKESTLVLESMA